MNELVVAIRELTAEVAALKEEIARSHKRHLGNTWDTYEINAKELADTIYGQELLARD